LGKVSTDWQPEEGLEAHRHAWPSRVELGIHDLRSWGRNWSRKVRETWNSGGLQGHEGGSGHLLSGAREAWLAPNVPFATVLPLHVPCRRPEIGFVFRLDSGEGAWPKPLLRRQIAPPIEGR
jgi:hypothetical protein